MAGECTGNIQVVDQAEVPTPPVKPQKKLNLMVAVIVGLVLGMGLAFFFEYLDSTTARHRRRVPVHGRESRDGGAGCPGRHPYPGGHPPHALDGVYANPVDAVLSGVAGLQTVLTAQNLDLTLHPGGDVHLATHMVERIHNGDACTIDNAGKFLLLELPAQMIPDGVKDEIFSLKRTGQIF